ncbi:MAG: hypothetical protein WC438_04680 [Candidatus Pacearchaeota archaeon]
MKRGLIIGIVAGVVIISAVFFLFKYTQKESIEDIRSINSEDAVENVCKNYTGLEECSSSLECEWRLNENKCDLIKITDNQGELDQNLEEINPNNLSNTLCNQLPTSSEFGLDDNYYCLAVVNNNPDFCEKILGDIDGPAIPGESEEDLNDKTPYYICLSAVNKDFSYCKLVKQDAKKTCYNALAQLSWNIDVCNNMDYNPSDKQECYFNFVNALYWENKSEEIRTDYCDKISDNLDKNTCLAFKERDVSLCGSNKNCLTFFPQELSFCNGATFKDEDECIRDRALVKRDISICDKLSDQTGRDDCYGDFANHIQQNITICDKIIGISRKRGCYINTAINLAK